jgi:hypothetical protein
LLSALEIRRKSSPSYAPSCSPTTSGDAAKGSIDYADEKWRSTLGERTLGQARSD